jgi:hypothetical protein
VVIYIQLAFTECKQCDLCGRILVLWHFIFYAGNYIKVMDAILISNAFAFKFGRILIA